MRLASWMPKEGERVTFRASPECVCSSCRKPKHGQVEGKFPATVLKHFLGDVPCMYCGLVERPQLHDYLIRIDNDAYHKVLHGAAMLWELSPMDEGGNEFSE